MKFLADENIRSQLLRGLLLRQPDLDIVRVQDVGLLGADDSLILEWAASQERILITHDLRTMPDFAYERIAQAQAMPGMIAIRSTISTRQAIEDLLIIATASLPDELEGRVLHLPL